MGAVWQIVTTGTDTQQRAAIEVLVETRRKLYGILADGDDPPMRTRKATRGRPTMRISDAERERRPPTWASTTPRVG